MATITLDDDGNAATVTISDNAGVSREVTLQEEALREAALPPSRNLTMP